MTKFHWLTGSQIIFLHQHELNRDDAILFVARAFLKSDDRINADQRTGREVNPAPLVPFQRFHL